MVVGKNPEGMWFWKETAEGIGPIHKIVFPLEGATPPIIGTDDEGNVTGDIVVKWTTDGLLVIDDES